MTEIRCKRCGETIDAVDDEWWSHRWDEQPSKQNVEKALEQESDFRDCICENIILCPDCHKRVVEVIHDYD